MGPEVEHGEGSEEKTSQIENEEAGGEIRNDMIYQVEDKPPWHACLLFGLQHYLLFIGSAVTIPLIAASSMCIEDDELGKSQVICTQLFVTGIASFLQTTLGCRLPIVQGPSSAFLPPVIAIMSLPKWECPESPLVGVYQNATRDTFIPEINSTYNDWRKGVWTSRMREGALIASALVQILFGCTGIPGALPKYIGPLTVATTISLIGLPLFSYTSKFASKHWGIAVLTVFLMTLFSQHLRNIQVPVPKYLGNRKWTTTRLPAFKLFPVLFTILIAWGLCGILTVSGALSTEKNSTSYGIRTDTNRYVLDEAPWFTFPYPGQWGIPTVSFAAVIGMFAAILSGTLDSLGDYYACAQIAGAPPPPSHAINRGILMEGICLVFAGLCGSGVGVSSYSSNIGALGLTKVASRRIIQVGSIFMVLFGLLGKVGAFFSMIPEPVLGGLYFTIFGMLTAVGVSLLEYVNLKSTRNLYIFGVSLFVGFTVPRWIKANPDAVSTGIPTVDQILTVFLSTSMIIGGGLAFLLDSTVPGTLEERGMIEWTAVSKADGKERQERIYNIPFGATYLAKMGWTKYIPFLPNYDPGCLKPSASSSSTSEFEIMEIEKQPNPNDGLLA